jgi:thiol-disulfide isomerase/thioredoxin
MVFIKQITNFAPSVSANDNFGKLKKTDYQWKFLDSGQQTKSLQDFNNKPILINFWATWCPPCIAEMPSLQKLENEYGSKVHFIFISHEDPQITLPFLREKKWNFSSYTPLLQEPELLQSNSLPTTFIIDKAGNIVVKKTGNHKWDSDSVKELLDQLIDK